MRIGQIVGAFLGCFVVLGFIPAQARAQQPQPVSRTAVSPSGARPAAPAAETEAAEQTGEAKGARADDEGPGAVGPGGTRQPTEEEKGKKKAKKKKKKTGCFGGGYQSLIFLVLMFVVFYFLLIRPQQKKQKEHQAMLSNLKVGDRVVTQGGMLGKITGFSDHFAVLEIQEKVRIKVLRSAISGKQGTEKTENNK